MGRDDNVPSSKSSPEGKSKLMNALRTLKMKLNKGEIGIYRIFQTMWLIHEDASWHFTVTAHEHSVTGHIVL